MGTSETVEDGRNALVSPLLRVLSSTLAPLAFALLIRWANVELILLTPLTQGAFHGPPSVSYFPTLIYNHKASALPQTQGLRSFHWSFHWTLQWRYAISRAPGCHPAYPERS